MFQTNMKSKLINEDSGFMVADGHALTSGRILFINKILRRWLLKDNEELKFMNINAIMPRLVADRHDDFMKQYNITGEAVLLNRPFLTFMLDSNNSLFPIEIIVKFHYSQKFQYCFIGFINPLRDMIPFRDMLKYKAD